uniref:Uncharacterized protein n=1 Tax=Strigamia maritima TaxID=126957 RepID=T1JK95_STRMM
MPPVRSWNTSVMELSESLSYEPYNLKIFCINLLRIRSKSLRKLSRVEKSLLRSPKMCMPLLTNENAQNNQKIELFVYILTLQHKMCLLELRFTFYQRKFVFEDDLMPAGDLGKATGGHLSPYTVKLCLIFPLFYKIFPTIFLPLNLSLMEISFP